MAKKKAKKAVKKVAKKAAKKSAPKKVVKKVVAKKAPAKKATPKPARPASAKANQPAVEVVRKTNTINPYLTFGGNCEDAFNFYRSVFGGEFGYIGRFKDMPPQENGA